eukprot:TRINITY_DN2061_c1_g1_i8.p1 TRINITY_DN2061_c1_g1~~TRINITY_DN2061_c1_g1_i8.p1  ORF type:complete len:723 (+),score=197.30 TRINITY_DN2061_c1_g1_i8:82-2250(+)
MSFSSRVIGIDFGNDKTRVSLMSPEQRMPDIVRNDFSLESTPSVVAFDDERRYVGEEGLSKVTSRPKWAANFLRKLFSPGATSESLSLGYKMTSTDTQLPSVDTPKGKFSIPQLLSMLFNTVINYARKMDDAKKEELPGSVTVAVPKGASDEAIQMVISALRIIGLDEANINVATEGQAAAQCYRGVRHEVLPKELTEEVKPIAIVDVGSAFATVTIARISRSEVSILSESCIATGSSSLDYLIMNNIIDSIKSQSDKELFVPGTKPYARLLKESCKAKEVMSTMNNHTLHAEALTETLDLSHKMTIDDIKKHAQPLINAVEQAIDEALKSANITAADLSEVEVIGGGWRTTCVQRFLKDKFSTDTLAVHLDPSQTVAQGCALIALRLDPLPEPETETETKKEETPEAENETPASVRNGVHYFKLNCDPLVPNPDKKIPDDELERMRGVEQELSLAEEKYNQRMTARNNLETYYLQLCNIAYSAKMSETQTEEIEALVREMDNWMLEQDDSEITVFTDKLVELKEKVTTKYPAINEYLKKQEEEEAAKEKQRQEQMKLAKETREPKTDPQRIKAAQERKDQGIVLFKAENYIDAVTRFVQALTHLKDIYDLENADIKEKRNTLALSCHLNIASSSLKLKKWSHCEKNCTQAIDYDPKSAKAYFRRGQARRQLNEFETSRADLTLALELSGGDSAIKKELDLLQKSETAQLKKDKKMFSKMFN